MYLPTSVLNSSINKIEIQSNQKIAKRLTTAISLFLKDNRSVNQNKSNENRLDLNSDEFILKNLRRSFTQNNNNLYYSLQYENSHMPISDELREEILNWLFTKTIEERQSICSIENKWLVDVVKALFLSLYSNEDNTNKDKQSTQDIFDDFYALKDEIIVLSTKLLSKKSNFFEKLSSLTNNFFLSSMIKVIVNSKSKINKDLYIDFPYWVHQFNSSVITIETLVIGFLDQIIQIKFFLEKKEKDKFEDEFKIYNILNKLNKLIDFCTSKRDILLSNLVENDLIIDCFDFCNSTNTDSIIDKDQYYDYLIKTDIVKLKEYLWHCSFFKITDNNYTKIVKKKSLIEKLFISSEEFYMKDLINNEITKNALKINKKKKEKKEKRLVTRTPTIKIRHMDNNSDSSSIVISGYNTASDCNTVSSTSSIHTFNHNLKNKKKKIRWRKEIVDTTLIPKEEEEINLTKKGSNNLPSLLKAKSYNNENDPNQDISLDDLGLIKRKSNKSAKINIFYHEDSSEYELLKQIRKENIEGNKETKENEEKIEQKLIETNNDNTFSNPIVSSDIKINEFKNDHKDSNNSFQSKHSMYQSNNKVSNFSANTNKSNNNSNRQTSNSTVLPKNGFLFQNYHYFPNQTQDFIFNHKIHNDILEVTNDTEYNLSLLMPYKQIILNNLREEVNAILKREVEFEVFGSFAVGFSIECSDIDLNLKLNEVETVNQILCEANLVKSSINILDSKMIFDSFVVYLSNGLRNYSNFYSSQILNSKGLLPFKVVNFYEEVTPILSASVPVIKLAIDLSYMISRNEIDFLLSKLSSSYIFPVSELFKFKIDISFSKYIPSISSFSSFTKSPSNKGNGNISEGNLTEDELGVKAKYPNAVYKTNTPNVEYVISIVKRFKEIKPLMLILKRLLQITNLNNTFTGGMSSFSLFLLILAFINIYNKKEITEETIGRDIHLPFLGNILIELLDFYGNIFSFESFVVNAGDENQPIISIETLEKMILNREMNDGKDKSFRKKSNISGTSFDDDTTSKNPAKLCLNNWNNIMISKAIIIDPINFTNVSQSSFNIYEVQSVFAYFHKFLIDFKSKNIEFDYNIITKYYFNLLNPSNNQITRNNFYLNNISRQGYFPYGFHSYDQLNNNMTNLFPNKKVNNFQNNTKIYSKSLQNNFNTPVKDTNIKNQNSNDSKENDSKTVIVPINKFNVSASSYYPRKPTIDSSINKSN